MMTLVLQVILIFLGVLSFVLSYGLHDSDRAMSVLMSIALFSIAVVLTVIRMWT